MTERTSQLQFNTNRREPREYLDSLYQTDYHDWKLFMWLASLKEIKNFISLFIIIWDAISLVNYPITEQELTNETNKMGLLLKELASLKAISNEQRETYDKFLDEYKNCRLKEINDKRTTLSKNAWVELIGCGLPSHYKTVAKKLNECRFSQKETLRMMVFSRMDSFISFAKQIQTKKETKTEVEEQLYGTSSVKESISNVTTKNSVESSEIARLKQQNVKLKAELGEITDPEWRDNDENNSMQLVEDIKNLNRALDKITRVKRDVKKINNDAVAELFSSLNCTTSVEDNRMSLVLDAALQQHIIKFILESAKDYFTFSQIRENVHITEDKLEAAILIKTDELIELIKRFEETFSQETEEIPRIFSTKLRKQNYATLGHRGFSNLNHSYIKELAKKLMNEMNKYRILESEEKNKKLEKQIIEIIIQILRICCFRFQTQEPIAKLKFYRSGKDIDPDFMEGTWDGHHEDYEVEVCSFPAVLTESDGRVYTKAKVIVRSKKK
jgi:hypothetical protein